MALRQDGTCTIPGALMGGWATPTDDQMPAGVAALAVVVGEAEAARASWQRRLVIMGDNKTFRMTVNECGFLSNGDLPQFAPGSVTATPVALPIAEAVALLKSKDNPELELARRRQFLAELNERHRKQQEDELNRQLAASKRQLDAQERAAAFRHSDWAALDVWQQAFYSLAIRVQERDPTLAADLKSVAGASRGVFGERSTPIAAPSSVWW
jgi:hypothetical protein